MAKQSGAIKLQGTFEGLCFYPMEGAHFVRTKSSLTGERFWKDAAFAGSRRSAQSMGAASALASRLYGQLPPAQKDRAVFQSLVGKIKKLLEKGGGVPAVEGWFRETYLR